MSSFDFDEGILAFATPRQCELILAWREHGGTRKASEALSVHRSAWAITYHKEYGPVGRVMVTPDMVR